MANATQIELAIYRSGLVGSTRGGPSPAKHITVAAKAVARHAARIARHQVNACNGIDRWDQKAQRFVASWTEEDQAKADRETKASRLAIEQELRGILKRGLRFDWKTDPRAGCVLRINDACNYRDLFI